MKQLFAINFTITLPAVSQRSPAFLRDVSLLRMTRDVSKTRQVTGYSSFIPCSLKKTKK